MTVLTFENVKKKEEGNDFNFTNLPLYKSHETTQEPTFQDMLPEERVEKFGAIEETSDAEIAIDKFKRAMNLVTNTLFGDIPYVRKALPENIRETKPEFPKEKIAAPLIGIGRDIALYSQAGKIFNIFSKGQTPSKVGRILQKTIKESFSAGALGALTAGSEDPVDIAKKAGLYAGIGAATVPAMEAVSFAGSLVAKSLGKSQKLQSIGEWLGLKLRENEVNSLARIRYGEINSKLIDSEKFLFGLEKQITKRENKSLAHLVEGGDLSLIKDERVKAISKSIRKYLDDAHADLMDSYGKDISFIKDYVPHIWDIPKNKESKVINWFVTRNPHLQKRRIDTIAEGIEKFGLKPKYENITDIIRAYDQVRIKSAANVKFVSELMELSDKSGVNLVQRVDKAPANWPIVDHPAVRKAMMVGKGTKNVPVEETVKTISETINKITNIEKRISGGISGGERSATIERLEGVIVGALESRGMQSGEARAYIRRLKSVYESEESIELISSKIEKHLKSTISKIETHKKPVEYPILSKVPIKVHPSIYPDVKAVLDTWQPGQATRVLDTANTFVKQAVLNLSLFHHMALSETGIAIGTGKQVMKAWNPITILKSFKDGTYKKVLQENVLAKEAVKDGLEVGAIADVEGGRNLVEVLKAAEKGVKSKALGLGIKVAIRKPLEFNNKFLWDYLHTTYKLNAYSHLKADMIKKFPKKDPKIIGQEVAQFVNDTFGGQPWDILTKSKEWQTFSRFVLLSPDWTLSTMKQALSPFGVGATSKAGVEIRKEMGKDFWRKALIYFGGAMNILNYSYTKAYKGEGKFMWENSPGKETYLFTGYNSDGTERYLRWGKQFRELAELIKDPTTVAGRKISPLIRITKHQVYPSEIWQKEIVDNKFWSKKGMKARAEQMLKDVTPYSLSQQQRLGEFSPFSFALPVSRGATPYSVRQNFREAILSKDKKLFERTHDAALENEIDPDPIFKQALSSIKSELTYDYKREASKIFIKLRKMKNNKERSEYIKSLNLDPGIEKQLLKKIKQHSTAIRKKKENE